MSGLYFLQNGDFQITRGTKGNILCHGIAGFSLILFYSTQCKHCQNLIPIFKQLPGTIQGCEFGMVNVSHNREILRLSENTIVPITYVPLLILYINGRPFMRYDGPHEEGEIRRFIVEVANKVANKQKFSEKEVKKNKRSIPAYCVGKPLYGDENKTYLIFDLAYSKNAAQGRQLGRRAQNY
uniref:Thioredoxin n=1 Tax=Iridovirus LCIVAC01 TaxID=2506607 RepID=A0A481YPT0_9VIRU|nr:MAG: thioredoxin [Iridovirus LCIVAC01]